MAKNFCINNGCFNLVQVPLSAEDAAAGHKNLVKCRRGHFEPCEPEEIPKLWTNGKRCPDLDAEEKAKGKTINKRCVVINLKKTLPPELFDQVKKFVPYRAHAYIPGPVSPELKKGKETKA